MAYDEEKGPEEATGLHLFQEVNKVRVKPGLGVFVDPHPDLTPDEDGKVPVYTKTTDSFEVMRFKTTKVRVDRFIQENREDLKAEKMLPETLALASTIAAGVFTEKALREFMGDDSEDGGYSYSSSRRDDRIYQEEDFETLEWKTGQGWVKKESAKKGGAMGGSTSWGSSWGWGWEGDEGSGYGSGYGRGGGYYGGSSYSAYQPKKKKYRVLAEQLSGIREQVKKEMWEGSLKVLEEPADLARVITVKLLEKVDVMDVKDLDKWAVKNVVTSIMSDVRWEIGYSSRYQGLLNQIEAYVEAMAQTIADNIPRMLTDIESPEKLMVDVAILMDVSTDEQKQALRSLFTTLSVERETEAEEKEKEEGASSWDREEELRPEDVERPPDPSMKIPKYHYDEAVWGKLRVVDHPLTPDAVLRKRVVTWKATDVGAHIGRLDRILTDQRIFREMRPTDSGSLLVDCSGSMGLSVQDVYKVLAKVPGAVIGLYSGSGGGGILHIVARNGKVAANLEAIIGSALRLGGNVVDGPSLEWLTTQPAPRIWYSDGGVTGLRDSAGYGLRDNANHLMRIGKIWRIRNQKKVPAAFKAMRKERTVGRVV
jgi:hypothetical protein